MEESMHVGEQETSLQDQSYHTIRRKIVYLDYKPGEKLGVKQLCDDLDMGRTPVREALVRLAQEGLVRTVPQSGTYVSPINLTLAESACYIREHLEKQVIVECCARATSAGIEQLDRAIVLQEKQHAEAVRQAPQRAFEAWLASYTADDWTNLWYEKRPENIDGRDRVRAYMEERFGSGSVQAFRSLDYTDEAPAYVLKDGDEALAKITLSGSDVNWAVSDVELELEGTKSASVEVAVGSKVFCNGTELGSEYAGETQNNFSYEPLKDKLINPVSWTTYTVDGLLIEPELTAEPPAGCSVTKTAEGDFMLCLDGADAEKYTTRAVSFVKAYLTYYMNGYNGTWGNLYAALAYLTPGTQAYTDLQDTYNGVVWNTAYGNIDVSNTTASGVVIWADNCYSVDVTYDANCTHNGQAIDYADATMRIYFLQTDAGFVISNYETL
mgnify:CR=1 FL=1